MTKSDQNWPFLAVFGRFFGQKRSFSVILGDFGCFWGVLVRNTTVLRFTFNGAISVILVILVISVSKPYRIRHHIYRFMRS